MKIAIDPICKESQYVEELKDALNVFMWQLANDHFTIVDQIEKADYIILPYERISEYQFKLNNGVPSYGSVYYYVLFLSKENLIDELNKLKPEVPYEWKWKYNAENPGYEVTSRGDKRYSPFFQFMKYKGKLISLEDYYKTVIKPAKENGTYIEGTGHRLIKDYLKSHKGLIYELARIGMSLPFTDMFDRDGGQNKWYAEILNEFYKL